MNRDDQQNASLTLIGEIADCMHQLLGWIRVMGYPTVKQTLEAVLDSEGKRSVYDLTNGKRGVKEIQRLTGVNIRYISEWGQEWEGIGIVEQSRISTTKGRRQKLFELSAFGIPVPEHKLSGECDQ